MAKDHLCNWLCRFIGCGQKQKQHAVFGWKVDPPKLKERNRQMLELTITNEQKVKVQKPKPTIGTVLS